MLLSNCIRCMFVALLCSLFLFSTHTSAQQKQDPLPPNAPVTIKSNVNVVLVPVLVRDSKDHVVDDLKKDDFKVFDRGKSRAISGFTIQKRTSMESYIKAAPLGVPTVVGGPSARTPQRFIVYLFDDMHLSSGD